MKDHLGTGRSNEYFVKPVPPTYVTEYQAAFTDPRTKAAGLGHPAKTTAYLNVPSMSKSSVTAASLEPSDSHTKSIRSLLETLEQDLDQLERDEKRLQVGNTKETNVTTDKGQSEKKRKGLDIGGAKDAVKNRKLDARIESVYQKLKAKHDVIKGADPLFEHEERIIADVDLIRQKLNE